MNISNQPFKLNPSVIPVKGANRSLLCDLEKNCHHYIPNALYEIITNKAIRRYNDVIQMYSKGNTEIESIIKGYFSFLLEEDLIIFSEFVDNYKEIELGWDYPAFITNSILDIDSDTALDFKSLFGQLVNLGCTDVQLRFFCDVDLNSITQNILDHLKNKRIKSIEILLPFPGKSNLFKWESIPELYSQIKYLQFFGAPQYDIIKEGTANGMGVIVLVEDDIIDQRCCGVISSHYFVQNMLSFTESLNHNSCLNRKISIDTEGNIKNCPSMKESYGNIKDTTLLEALEKPGFKKYWNITKDQISVCKDCEFRYICTDCRAYLEDPDDIYSKPLKCGYNPYTCEWEEWSTNPLKEKAIKHYGMERLTVD
ncbi:grasp-with-spasm system SPASM domain peptide maturase [Phaeodactylibacter xiamenensis]|jgi:SPASM domain peptide maturase of grasp-with-spasm system|uniref:grasp-with-spasm system SPASM domain peptide maturase n=1 Tax=Phaeodactylibacter xiamenensis TaxID=1524460 RepID=UPI0024A9EAA3|nr:grasp-with-spasm system SPASM domain peptide maturase [Phaeodactylibacter xiamenensis]